ncbi:band 4.1-like protein 4B [Zootoca vivipara]|uniref:band 4.1-like protein 4B n=1 Tax=Zootoca vivipara TaxID=8524 RepID=UPI00293BEC32|nr:band 4.1-like protein 4B [Zootoca vivipara]
MALACYPLNSAELHPFNIEENGGTPSTTKMPGRPHHHLHLHHHHHHSNYGALAPPDNKDSVAGMQSPNRVSRHYEDASPRLKKMEVETAKVGGPWSALHISMNKGEDSKTSEKSLHPPPVSPSSVPDHFKCNILKAQVEAAFRVGPQVGKEETSLTNPPNTSSLQDPNVRNLAPLWPETTQTSSVPEKQEVKAPRVRKLMRQYSFDEDDLPPALAAAVGASPPLSSASPGSQRTNSEGHFPSCAKSPTDTGGTFALAPGDLLMDFTEATPMAEFIDNKLQCCVVQSSPKMLSPVAPASGTKSLVGTFPTPTVQTIYSSHKPISLADSAETLRRELEREKLMKRLLMTEL